MRLRRVERPCVCTNSYKNAANPAKDTSDAVIAVVNCVGTTVPGNKIAGSDAAHAIWVAGSAGMVLRGNTATHLTAPDAKLSCR